MANSITKATLPAQPVAESSRGKDFYSPRVDIWETDQELVLQADLPGVSAENLDLQYENGELILHGKVNPRQPGTQYLDQEYATGDFYRVFRVHESIDSNKIDAACKNGVLTLHLPKAEAVKPRQISIRAS